MRHWLVCLLLIMALPVAAEQIRLQLDRTDPRRSEVDGLQFRGAVVLPPGAGKFGGLSALHVEDADHLLVLSDMAKLFRLTLHWDREGKLVGATPDRGTQLLDENGQPPKGRARWDAEALTKTSDGWLVAFERDHRIEKYADQQGRPVGSPTPWATPPGLATLPRNEGLESLLWLPDGRLFALAEGRERGGAHPAWLWQDGHWQRLSYVAGAGLDPSDAALAPDGSVVILERGFNLLYGFRARLARLNLDEIRPGTRLAGVPFLSLESPILSENFEGLAVAALKEGGLRYFVISDNNFNAAQQTILAVFDQSPVP
jgi:hypothetical protein